MAKRKIYILLSDLDQFQDKYESGVVGYYSTRPKALKGMKDIIKEHKEFGLSKNDFWIETGVLN